MAFDMECRTTFNTALGHGRRRVRALPVVGAAVALAIALGSPVAIAADGQSHRKTDRAHHVRALHPRHRFTRDAQALPYRPENGFLHRVPANAIRMPGYTFVPGVGILDESCDLPTSACSNQYRDIQ